MAEQVENKKINNPVEQNKSEFDFDELKLYFSEPYLIRMRNGHFIEITQPSFGDVLRLGDREVYDAISPFVCNTTSYRVSLWENGVDWNKISDYKLFRMLVPTISGVEFLIKRVYYIENKSYNRELSKEENFKNGQEEYVKIHIDIDFSKLKEYSITNEDAQVEPEIVLYDPEQGVIIDEQTYKHMREYIRTMFDNHPKEEFAKGKLAKQWIIEEEKKKIEKELAKNVGRRKSPLLPLVSGLLNHPGFKYDLEGMKKIGIFAFMDSVRRLQVYEQSIAFLGGMYSGMMDCSKIGQEELNNRVNWLQDIYEK